MTRSVALGVDPDFQRNPLVVLGNRGHFEVPPVVFSRHFHPALLGRSNSACLPPQAQPISGLRQVFRKRMTVAAQHEACVRVPQQRHDSVRSEPGGQDVRRVGAPRVMEARKRLRDAFVAAGASLLLAYPEVEAAHVSASERLYRVPTSGRCSGLSVSAKTQTGPT
jgi:hypothetical protein